ncbi:MAG: GNAT family N-acetyltransferase [Bacteroidales bacterium]|jgi:ribosomal protein S18 acetylase RimI-like enzyme
MQTIKSLKDISFDELFISFNEAFGSYEVQVNKEELRVMLKRRGFVKELSFGVFEDERLISFTLNGIGQFNGLKTAYDTGTGTIEEFRGKGIASTIFNYSLPFLKEAGVKQYLLEVLQHNTNAVSVYRKLGFETIREFNYFKQANELIKLNSKDLLEGFCFKEMDLGDKNLLMKFWDFTPSWQNSFEAIERSFDDFKIIGVYKDDVLIGYSIFEPNSGDLTQIAISKEYRRQGLGSALLCETLKYNTFNSVKAVNTEINCESVTAFLESNNIPLCGKQFEMIKKL